MKRERPVAPVLHFRLVLHALVMALVFAPALLASDPTESPVDLSDVGGSSLLNVQQMEARKAARSGMLRLQPGVAEEMEARAARAPEVPIETEYDLAVLPFRNISSKQRAGLIYSKIQEYFRKKGLNVVSRPNVDRAIKKLGVLSTEAITVQDCEQLAIDLKARYLVVGTARLHKADTSFSPAGSIISGARVLVGGFAGAAAVAGLPFLIGGLAFSLVAGFSNTASAELECRIYDVFKRKVIWVGAESAQRRKDFMAVFADKRKLEIQALERGVAKIFGPVISRLTSRKRRVPISD